MLQCIFDVDDNALYELFYYANLSEHWGRTVGQKFFMSFSKELSKRIYPGPSLWSTVSLALCETYEWTLWRLWTIASRSLHLSLIFMAVLGRQLNDHSCLSLSDSLTFILSLSLSLSLSPDLACFASPHPIFNRARDPNGPILLLTRIFSPVKPSLQCISDTEVSTCQSATNLTNSAFKLR